MAKIRLTNSSSNPIPPRLNVYIQQDSSGTWAASPDTLDVANGYGEAETSYIKWYILPANGGVTFAQSNGVFNGISFSSPPAGMSVNYDPAGVTASVNWENSGSSQENFSYTITLSDGTVISDFDPDVENQAPPAPTV